MILTFLIRTWSTNGLNGSPDQKASQSRIEGSDQTDQAIPITADSGQHFSRSVISGTTYLTRPKLLKGVRAVLVRIRVPNKPVDPVSSWFTAISKWSGLSALVGQSVMV